MKRVQVIAFTILILSLLAGCSKTGKRFRIDIMNPAAQLYDHGLEEYRRGNLAKAKQYFSDIVNYYPNNDLADEAAYMLAVCYQEEGDLVNALAYYKLVVEKYPTSKKYQEALKRVKEIEEKLKREGSNHGSS